MERLTPQPINEGAGNPPRAKVDIRDGGREVVVIFGGMSPFLEETISNIPPEVGAELGRPYKVFPQIRRPEK